MKLSTLLKGSRGVDVLLGERKLKVLEVDKINFEALQLLKRIEAERVVVTKKAIEVLQLLKPQDFFDWFLVVYPKLKTFQRCRDKLEELFQEKVKEAKDLKALLPLSSSLHSRLCYVVTERAMQLRDAEVAAAFFYSSRLTPSSPTTLLLYLYPSAHPYSRSVIARLIGERVLRQLPEGEIKRLLEDEEERRFGEQVIAKLEGGKL